MIRGATEERGIYDRRPTLGSVLGLSGAAVETVPQRARASFDSVWGGLRPGTPDQRPIIGSAEDWDGLLIAAGTYRNGVLLAPIVGESITALALVEEPPADVSPFSLGRFAAHLVVPNELVVEIVAYAERGAPEEVCGWLAGRETRRCEPTRCQRSREPGV